jgi:hypothetical protein
MLSLNMLATLHAVWNVKVLACVTWIVNSRVLQLARGVGTGAGLPLCKRHSDHNDVHFNF